MIYFLYKLSLNGAPLVLCDEIWTVGPQPVFIAVGLHWLPKWQDRCYLSSRELWSNCLCSQSLINSWRRLTCKFAASFSAFTLAKLTLVTMASWNEASSFSWSTWWAWSFSWRFSSLMSSYSVDCRVPKTSIMIITIILQPHTSLVCGVVTLKSWEHKVATFRRTGANFDRRDINAQQTNFLIFPKMGISSPIFCIFK